MAISILGTMSGTSCDGLDATLLTITPTGWKPQWSHSARYPRALAKKLLTIQFRGTKVSLKDLLVLQRDLSNWYGQTLHRMIQTYPSKKPHAIAMHGQTIAYFPADKNNTTGLLLGDPTRVAHHTGLTVISNMREGDMAAGGLGAPLAPRLHRLIAQLNDLDTSGVIFQNIGGIANLSYVHNKFPVFGFDTGPGNAWIDAAVSKITKGKKHFDRDGAMTSKGTPDEKAVQKVIQLSYFKKTPPKTTGRDQFPFSLLEKHTRAKGNDLVATASECTIRSILKAYNDWIFKKNLPVKAVYLCGGGAKNTYLHQRIQQGLASRNIQVFQTDALGLPCQQIESIAFAAFGFLSLLGKSIGGKWTRAQTFGPPGHIIPGANWKQVLDKIQLLSKQQTKWI